MGRGHEGQHRVPLVPQGWAGEAAGRALGEGIWLDRGPFGEWALDLGPLGWVPCRGTAEHDSTPDWPPYKHSPL